MLTRAGLVRVYFQLAQQAQKGGNLKEADKDINLVLKADPQNVAAREFKTVNDRLLAEQAGRIPDEATVDKVNATRQEKVTAGTLVQNGRVLMEACNRRMCLGGNALT